MAVELPEQVKKEVHEYRNEVRRRAKKGRWRHSDNFHLTLKFFDELSGENHDYLDALLTPACGKLEPFVLEVGDLGIFDGRAGIRTLWIGIEGDRAALERLYQLTEEKSDLIGFSRERRKFSPHITLGQDIELVGDFIDLKKTLERPAFTEIPVNSLFLFKSEQIADKRIYTKVSDYKFME